MRAVSIVIVIVAGFCSVRAARSEPAFHLPCDRDGSFGAASGIFNGQTSSDAIGQVRFDRFQVMQFRLELAPFDNCRRDEDLGRPEVTRAWFGRLNVRGSIGRDRIRLYLLKEAERYYHTNEDNTQSIRTRTTLTRADLDAGYDEVYDLGASLSIFDGPHVHLEAFYDRTASLGNEDADPTMIVVQALEAELDMTQKAREETDIRYYYRMEMFGLTAAFPLRSNTTSRWRLTPYVTAGYLRLKASAGMRLHHDMRERLHTLGIDTEALEAVQVVRKAKPSGLMGVRLDISEAWSFHASLIYGPGRTSRVTAVSAGLTWRFDLPNLRRRLSRFSAYGGGSLPE